MSEDQSNEPRLTSIPAVEQEVLNTQDSTDAAVKEAQQLSSGKSLDELKKEAAQREHERIEDFRDLFDGCVKIAILLAFVGIVLFGAVWVWHLLTPESWHWLSSGEIDHIQNIVTGGVLAALVSDHFKRRLG